MTPSEPSYREIPVSPCYVAKVDLDDYEKCASRRWCARIKRRRDGTVCVIYAHASAKTETGKKTTELLHRFILGVKNPKIEVEHRDHDGLNCQKSNLRESTRSQNMRNQRTKPSNKTGYKGVSWHSRVKKYVVWICVDGKNRRIGYSDDPIDAAKMYDEAAKINFGDFACLNFPAEGIQ